MKERNMFWDNYKGVLIFLVVFGHFIYSYAMNSNDKFVELIYIFIYTFHMPAFVFCSGYFSKSERSRGANAICKLLLCYLIFNTFMMLFSYFYIGKELKILTPYYSYWYIISLICWRILIRFVERIKYIIPISLVIMLLIGYWGEFSNILSIRRTIAFFPFFLMGYFLKKEKIEDFLSNRKLKTYIIGWALVVIFLVLAPYVIYRYGITAQMTLMVAYKSVKDVYRRCILLIMASVAIWVLMLVVPNRKIPLLSQIGKNSLLIYLGHRFLTIIFYKELFTANSFSMEYVGYAFIATVLTCIGLGNELLSMKFNGIIKSFSDKMVDFNNNDGNRVKTAILIGVIICLSLRPILGL